MSKIKRILCIDGGGVRGIIPGRFLQELENRTKMATAQLFDIVTGVSIGAILALLLLIPENPSYCKNSTTSHGLIKPKYKASDFVQLLVSKAGQIFHLSKARQIKTLGGLIGAKYDRSTLDGILLDLFQNTKLSQALSHVITPFFALNTLSPVTPSSFLAQTKGPSEDFYCKDVVAASSAAPTYFSPYNLQNVDQSKKFRAADGGTFFNNPELIGLSAGYNAENSLEIDDILLVSLGSGSLPPTTDHTISNDGIIGWMRGGELIHDMFDVRNLETQQIASTFFKKEGELFRLQPVIPTSAKDLDNASPENLQTLLHAAESYIQANDKLFHDLAEKLKNPEK